MADKDEINDAKKPVKLAEKPKAAEQADETPASNPNEGLVRMDKGDNTLYVHPTTVKAHEAIGWKVA